MSDIRGHMAGIVTAVLLVVATAVGCSAPESSLEAEQEQPPNVILILADDLGSADLGAYGGTAIATPSIDRFAAQGLRFTQAYAGSTVCGPSRSTLMTGLHTGHTPVRSNTGGVSLRDDDVTLAEVLKAAGHATGGFGKWGLAEVGFPGVPERQGFDEFFGYYHQIHAHEHFPAFLYRNGERVELPANRGFYDGPLGEGRGIGPVPPRSPSDEPYQFAHALIVERMKAFIREHRDRPFFAYGAWTPPHSRWEVPEDDPAWKLYADRPWPLEAKVAATFTSIVDRHVGEIVELLDELDIGDRTIVLFASDNGGLTTFNREPLRTNGMLRGGKTTLWEGGLRVPLIARWPGRIAPGTADHLTYFPDVMPTIAELTGASAHLPPNLDGLSLVPVLLGVDAAGRSPASHEYLYWEDADIDWTAVRYLADETLRQAVRSGRWKAIRPAPGAALQLYDLESDPGETTDLAAEHPDMVAQMATWMDEAHVEPPPQDEPPRLDGRMYR